MNSSSDGRKVMEIADSSGKLLAIVIRQDFEPASTRFVTPQSCGQQVGFIVYNAGSSIPSHKHLPIRRTLIGTTEVVLVRKGSCTVEIFDDDLRSVEVCELQEGDVILLNGGGHGFRIHEDTVLLEVKQGPFTNEPEKVRF